MDVWASQLVLSVVVFAIGLWPCNSIATAKDLDSKHKLWALLGLVGVLILLMIPKKPNADLRD